MAPRPELCVGAVVADADGRLLLIERGRGPAIGQWSVPGGRVEPGETMTDAVVREVAEETGLAVVCGALVGWVERISDQYHFVIMDFRAEVDPARSPPGTRPIAGDDASDVAWVSPDQLDRYPLVAGLEDFLRSHGVL